MPENKYELPNLRKDRIVLELTNRTNADQTIPLFAMPAGINPSQNIEYGDLFETKYSVASILQTEFSTLQTYTITWTDESGAPQTATTIALNDIDILISELIILTDDNWAYYTTATTYVVHKIPIDTWVYWSPVPNGTSSPTVLPFLSSTQPIPISQYRQTFVYGDRQYVLQSDILSYFDYPNTTTIVGFIDLSSSGFGGGGFQWIGGVDSSNILMCYDYNLNRIAGIDISGVPSVSFALNGVGSSGNFTYDANFNIWWSGGGSGGTADNILKVFDTVFTLLDFWSAGGSLNLSATTFGENKVLINSATDYWAVRGRQGSPIATKGLQKFGGWNDGTSSIIQTTSTLIAFDAEMTAQTGTGMDVNDIPNEAIRIGSTNTFFVVVINVLVVQQCFIGTVNTDTQAQNWAFYENNDLYIRGDVYYSTMLDRIIAKLNYGGVSSATIRSINYNTLEVDSVDLGENGVYNQGSLMYDDPNNTIFRADNSPQGFAVSYPVGGTLTAPSGTEPESFYTENSFTDITANTSANTYLFSTYDVLGGTGISIIETTGNLPYYALVQGLRNNTEPYFFQDMSIYADTIAQANEPITKVLRGVSGASRKLIDNPVISSVEQNFVIIDEPIDVAPKTINKIEYRVKAFETVTVIINYTKGNLNAIAETLDEYIKEGIPFDVGIKQLAEAVSKNEESYLRDILKRVWKRREEEEEEVTMKLSVEAIFATSEGKRKELGAKTKAVQTHLQKIRLKELNVEGVSPENIKKIVANYVAKGKADKIHDDYDYLDGKED